MQWIWCLGVHDLRWYNKKYHLWNEVYYRNDMWWGAEHNDQRMDSKSKLKIEISEKKRGEFVCF